MEKLTADQIEARDALLRFVKPGDTVYTVLRQVSRSGMSRVVSLYALQPGGDPQWLDGWTARLTGITFDRKREGLKMQGCGTDMGFEAVYHLSASLWPEGFGCPGEPCHSNDHSNGDRDYTPHQHRDGGYALRQRWL